MELIPFGALAGLVVRLFQVRPNDIPVCHTRMMSRGRIWPWSHNIAVHPRPDGKLEITKIP